MDKKCEKYEALFTFGTDEEFQKHLAECEDCRQEHERMQRVSDLIAEVKPQFKAVRKDKYRRMKIACVFFMIMVTGVSLETADMQYGIVDQIMYGERITPEKLGLPTDSYGLLMVDDLD